MNSAVTSFTSNLKCSTIMKAAKTTKICRRAPPMNMLDAAVSDGAIQIEGQKLPFESRHNGKVRVGLRPERIQVGGDGPSLKVEISVLEDLGATRLVHGRLGGQELTLSQDADLLRPQGQVNFSFRTEDLHLFDKTTGRRLRG